MELFVAVVSGLIASLLLWLWRSSSKGKQPPGPWNLPIVGYLPFLTSKPFLTLTKLSKRYGNVFSIRIGGLKFIILNDFQSTKEVFSQDACIARPTDGPFELNKETIETGAFFGIGWKEQRRHCLHMLRDLGLGKTKMEGHIEEEINEVLEIFEKNVGKPFSMRPVLAASMSNNIASLLFGKRMKHGDPTQKMLMRVIRESSSAGSQLAFLLFFPWLSKLVTFLGFGKAFSDPNTVLRNYVMKEINEHEKTFNPDNIRDFVDSYLLEIQRRKDDPTFSKAMLQDLAGAFFGAGSETVRSSVEFLVLAVASNQKVQQRIYQEIQNEIGLNRTPLWTDYQKMPYTNAVIMEVMRWRTLIPLNLLRYTLVDTTVSGFFIPKHTRILSNHWAIHHDPEYWGPDADEFRPERFLTDDGKEVKKFDRYVPFSIGKRSCPGEPLARVEIFLYFASILQRFHVKMPEGKEADFEGELGIGYNPKEQDVVLTKRN